MYTLTVIRRISTLNKPIDELQTICSAALDIILVVAVVGGSGANITRIVSYVPKIPEDNISTMTSKVYMPGIKPCNNHTFLGKE